MRFPRPGTSQGTALRGNQGPRGSFRLCASYLSQDPTSDAAAAARVPAPPAVSPRRNRAGRAARASLAALLDVRPDELLGVLLKHLVDLVEDRIHVVSELVLSLPDLLGILWRAVRLLLGAPGRLPLASGVLCRHLETSVLRGQCPQPQRYLRQRAARPTLPPAIGMDPECGRRPAGPGPPGGLRPGPSAPPPARPRSRSDRASRQRAPGSRAAAPGSGRAAGTRGPGCRR